MIVVAIVGGEFVVGLVVGTSVKGTVVAFTDFGKQITL